MMTLQCWTIGWLSYDYRISQWNTIYSTRLVSIVQSHYLQEIRAYYAYHNNGLREPYWFAQNSKSVPARSGLSAMVVTVPSEEHPSLMILVLLESAFYALFKDTLALLDSTFFALFNDTLDKATACSQQKLWADQCGYTFYCHVRGLHIINSHIRNTNSHFPINVWTSGQTDLGLFCSWTP